MEPDQTCLVIADDHELNSALKGSFFERSGFVLHRVLPGDDVYAIVKRDRPVLVILALDTKQSRADLVCRKIKDDSCLHSTPVALIAHYEDEEERTRCHESGCDEILRRPLGSKQVLAAAYRMLNVVVDRFEFRGVVRFEGRCGTEPRVLRECSILNLSGGGAFIETGKLRPVDSAVFLEFSLPENDRLIRCRGRVAWLNHPVWSKKPRLPIGYGVQFEDLSSQCRQQIEDYIHSRTEPCHD